MRKIKQVSLFVSCFTCHRFQHRAPQEPERVVQRRLPERSQAVPSGVRRPAVVSLDNDDGSGDEDMSVYSCVSSDNSGEFIDDPTAAVDASGHLRPVEEDDVFLATQSSISEDEQQEQGTDDINDDHNDEVERTEGTRSKTKAKLKSGLLLSAATLSSRTNSQQGTQLAPSSVKGTARHWSRHKVQPKSLPNITVVDFGEEDSRLRLAEADLEQPEGTNDQRYVEPVVVVENESDTTSSARTKRPDLAAAGRKSRILTRAAAKTTKGSRGDIPVVSGGKKLSNVVSAMKGEASSHTAPEDTGKDTDRQSSKRKFASALARFQSIEQTTWSLSEFSSQIHQFWVSISWA